MSTNRPTTHAQSCRASALPPKERSTRITGTRTREGRERPEHAWAPTARVRRGGSGGRRRGEAGPGTHARRVPGDGKAHRQRHGQRGATTGRRDDERRRRAEGCANGPAGRGRRPGEEGNRAREGRRCSPRKESRSSSLETANRRRG
jgi:hypothetical protein